MERSTQRAADLDLAAAMERSTQRAADLDLAAALAAPKLQPRGAHRGY